MTEWDWGQIFVAMTFVGTMALYGFTFPMVAINPDPRKSWGEFIAVCAYGCLSAVPFIGMAALVARRVFWGLSP